MAEIPVLVHGAGSERDGQRRSEDRVEVCGARAGTRGEPRRADSGLRATPTRAGRSNAERSVAGRVARIIGSRSVVATAKSGPNRPSLWRVSIEGGEPTLVQTESFDALPSPSGRLIYYSAFEWEERQVRLRVLRWIVISSTDQKRLFGFDSPTIATLGTLPVWAPDESGLDYVVTRSGVSNIWRQPLTGGPPVQITHYSAGKIFSFAWSPDGRWLSLATGVNRSDVVLMSRQP